MTDSMPLFIYIYPPLYVTVLNCFSQCAEFKEFHGFISLIENLFHQFMGCLSFFFHKSPSHHLCPFSTSYLSFSYWLVNPYMFNTCLILFFCSSISGRCPLSLWLGSCTFLKIMKSVFMVYVSSVMPDTFFSKLFIYLFSFMFISWRLTTLQYCGGFCHALTLISHEFTCVPHPEKLILF